jgi:hypothetical protein
MIDRDGAERFAAAWVEAWNSHDVDRVLAHFHEDAEFASPLVPVLTGGTNPLHGVDAIRAYWEEGLRRLPDLHFELDSVHVGENVVGINYRNERGRSATEVLVLDGEGRARQGWALYGPDPG